MILAARRVQAIGSIMFVFLVAISLYPLSLSVAKLRSDIETTEADIVATRERLAYLETEFDTRANMRQLVQWNEVEFGFVAPRAEQFVEGERALAALGAGPRPLPAIGTASPAANRARALALIPEAKAAEADGKPARAQKLALADDDMDRVLTAQPLADLKPKPGVAALQDAGE